MSKSKTAVIQQITPPRQPNELKSCCAPKGRAKKTQSTQTVTLDSLLDQYVNKNVKADHEKYLSRLRNITEFICGVHNEIVAPAGPPYDFSGHQWHLKLHPEVVNIMAEKLKDIDKESFEDFEALHAYVKSKKEKFFSDTCIYDFALRYGWNHTPRIEPKDYVYIHAKPRESAVHLYNLGYIPKIDTKLPLSNYSELLRPGMTAADVEHFLCCYHKDIMRLKKR